MTHLTEKTGIKILIDGVEKWVTLDDFVEYLKGTFTVKRAVWQKDKEDASSRQDISDPA